MKKILKITTNDTLELIDITEESKDSAQLLSLLDKQVGGFLEIVRPIGLYAMNLIPPTACMSVNENGIAMRLPINKVGSRLYGAHSIVGDVLIMDEVMTPEGAGLAGFEDSVADLVYYAFENYFKEILKTNNEENGGNDNE